MEQTLSNTLSAKNLMPTDWSVFGQLSGNINPLLSAGISVIYGIDPDFVFTIPSVTYSISDNWDITLLEQGVYNTNSSFNSDYIRLKCSF